LPIQTVLTKSASAFENFGFGMTSRIMEQIVKAAATLSSIVFSMADLIQSTNYSFYCRPRKMTANLTDAIYSKGKRPADFSAAIFD